MDYILLVLQALWFIFPAYIANSVPVILKGKHPVDMNLNFFDGEPVFGGGKTWEGLIGGTLSGGIAGFVQNYLFSFYSLESYGFIEMTTSLGLVLGFGALFGDMLGSFIKRRFKVKRGEPFPVLDQLDFVFGAWFLSSFIQEAKLSWIIIILIITPISHKVTNYLAYKLKLKNVPW